MFNIIPNRSRFKTTLEVPYWRKALSMHSMYKIIFNKWRFKTILEDPYWRKTLSLHPFYNIILKRWNDKDTLSKLVFTYLLLLRLLIKIGQIYF